MAITVRLQTSLLQMSNAFTYESKTFIRSTNNLLLLFFKYVRTATSFEPLVPESKITNNCYVKINGEWKQANILQR